MGCVPLGGIIIEAAKFKMKHICSFKFSTFSDQYMNNYTVNIYIHVENGFKFRVIVCHSCCSDGELNLNLRRVTLSNSRAENTPVAMILSFPETPE